MRDVYYSVESLLLLGCKKKSVDKNKKMLIS